MTPSEITKITCQELSAGKFRYMGHDAAGKSEVIRASSTKRFLFACRFDAPVIGSRKFGTEPKLTNYFGFTNRPAGYKGGCSQDDPAQTLPVE